MMVLDLVHQNVMILIIPKVNYDGIAVIDYLSHCFDVFNIVIMLEGVDVSWKCNFTGRENINKIVWWCCIRCLKFVICNLELFFFNAVLFFNLFQNGFIWYWFLVDTRKSDCIPACWRNHNSFDLFGIVALLLVIILIVDVKDGFRPVQHQIMIIIQI